MIHAFSLVLMTKKELFDLLVEEKRTSYRRGYKAGAAMRYRHTEKPVSPKLEWLSDGPAIPLSKEETERLRQGLAEQIFTTPPTVYGDSLPVKDTLTSEK
jgi:hypothetical protein